MTRPSRRMVMQGLGTAAFATTAIGRAARPPWDPTTSSISSSGAARCSTPARSCAAGATSASATAWSRRSRRRSRRSAPTACSTRAASWSRRGSIDLHAHVYPYGSAIGIPADELVPFQGTTTVVSAGDAGANNFAAFRRHIVAQTRTRIYAFVHIANMGLAGFPVPRAVQHRLRAGRRGARKRWPRTPTWCSASRCACRENVIAKHGLEPLRRAIRGLRDGGHRGQGDVPHRRRADAAS